jgi:hypothetical protein
MWQPWPSLAIGVKCVRRPGELRRTTIPIPARQVSGVATRSWHAVGRVLERPSWLHMAAVALHSAIDVKCSRRLDCPRELRRTVVPVLAPQAGGVTSRLAIDVKCACRFDCLGELRRTVIPVATRTWSHVAVVALHFPLMSTVFAVPESLGARPFSSLLDRPAALPDARLVMLSALATPTVP